MTSPRFNPSHSPNPKKEWASFLQTPPQRPLASIHALMGHAEERAQFAMRHLGGFPLTVFGLAEGSFFTFTADSLPEEAKDDFTETSRLVCLARAASATVLAAEAWVRFPQPNERYDPAERVSEAFDRREVVILVGEAKDVRTQKLLPIIRTDAGGFFGFGEASLPPTDTTTGRFANLLPSPPPTLKEQLIATALLRARGCRIDRIHS